MKHKRKHHTKSKSKPHSKSKSRPHSTSKSKPHSRSTSAYSKASSVNSKSISAKTGWWRSRTSTEKLLIPVSFLLMILSVILLVVIVVMATTNTSSKNEPQVCSTPGCVQASHYFLHAMNTSVDPCTDFFEFSCGLWSGENGATAHSKILVTRINTALKVLLSKNVASESKAINMARMFYQSCMNMARIEELKSGPLVEAINALGKWPILEAKWDKNSFKLTDLLVTAFLDYNANPFFLVGQGLDFKDSSKKILFFDQGQVGIYGTALLFLHSSYSREFAKYREYFQKVIVQLLKTDGKLTKSDDEINGDIDKVIAFETAIAKIMVPAEVRRDVSRFNNKRKVQDLYELMPQVNWVDYIQRMVSSDVAYIFNNQTEIIIKELDYMKKLSKLLESSDVVVVTNYIIWTVVVWSAEYLDKRFPEFGKKEERWKTCISHTSQKLPLAASAIYVEEHFGESDKQEALDLVLDLKKSFLEMIQKTDWMDEETKAEAIAKLNSMGRLVGYPDEIKDLKKLDEMYKGLEINQDDSFFKVSKKIFTWNIRNAFNELAIPSNKRKPTTSPIVVNAHYVPPDNKIELQAGILQPPFFSGMFPKAVNFGAIGAVIGHEITHGFDDQGSQYDKDGNVRNWFSESSLKAFNKKKSCIVDQYGRYAVPGTTHKINGVMTQGENIADNGGLRVAFRAYQKYVKEHGEEPRLPGFKQYSNEQIFFLSFAHCYCGGMKGEELINQILTDPHSPNEFRANGGASNMKEFADAFKCPKNSPINPDHKCVVW